MVDVKHGFPKTEHLCWQRDITQLFHTKNKAIMAFPFRLVFHWVDRTPDEPAMKVLLSVSKKKRRHAVDRNRCKRQLREAYRLHKHLLWTKIPADRCLHLGFVWISPNNENSALVHKRMHKTLEQLQQILWGT